MATFTLHCPCGETFHADVQHIGRRLRCRQCGGLVTIQRQSPERRSTASPEQTPPHDHQPDPSHATPPRPQPTSRPSTRAWWKRPALVFAAMGMLVLAAMSVGAFLRLAPPPVGPTPTHVTPPRDINMQNVPPSPAFPPAPSAGPTVLSPFPCNLPPRSLPTGTELGPLPLRAALGKLTIQNGRDVDAVVRLVEAQYQRMISRSVYIRAGDSVTLSHIAVGHYRLQFALGYAWDKARHDFLCRADHLQFRRILDFDELPDAQGTHYTTMQFTLHPVLGGTEHPQSITPEAWQGGHWPTGGPATTHGVQNPRY